MTESFRPMQDDDLNAVIDLWERCDLTRPWNPPAEDIAQIRQSPHAELFVAVDADRLASTFVVCEDGHRGWVYYLSVAPEHRKGGWGRRAMRHAEDWVRDRGLPKLQLMVRHSNADVRAFYDALGYEDSEVVVLQKWLTTDRETLYRGNAHAT